jgi:two-component system, sensor histidine kinase and response regulator
MDLATVSPVVPPASTPPTVLVVDDEPDNCEMLTLLLTAKGFTVVTAADGAAALETVTASPPDVILLDVMMPILDGFQVCQQLKAQSSTLFIPVVLLTALHSTKDRIRGAAAGADDFISKPFDDVELTTRIKSLLRLKILHDQLELQNRGLERRVAERTAALQQALTELQALDRLKSQFIANVSHELRTPLMHVKGSVQLLADGALGALSPAQVQSVHVAQTAIAQLENIVADVVDFGDSPRRPLVLEAVDLTEICQAAIAEVTADAARQRIPVGLTLPPGLPLVLANRPALIRLLQHLLDNALKFSSPERPVSLSAESSASGVRISVQDSGCGIPDTQVDRIFDTFYQVDGATTRRANGLGIGLSVVKKLAEAHGAQVRVDSQIGQGSRFYFDLQAAPQPTVDSPGT